MYLEKCLTCIQKMNNMCLNNVQHVFENFQHVYKKLFNVHLTNIQHIFKKMFNVYLKTFQSA